MRNYDDDYESIENYNIMLAGVGGQGILFAARVLGAAALKKGYEVKICEVHGMAQRGGSVVSHARIGKKIYAPVVEKGRCDLLIGFELLEALRWLDYLREDGRIILNEQRIDPMPVLAGKARYPEDVTGGIRRRHGKVEAVNALKAAENCGDTRAVNMVLLGLAARRLPIEKELWLAAVKEAAPPRLAAVNLKAFVEGYRAAGA